MSNIERTIYIQINRQNAATRIMEAIQEIMDNWDEWDAEANQNAQQQQCYEAYVYDMQDQLRNVLEGMVFDINNEV